MNIDQYRALKAQEAQTTQGAEQTAVADKGEETKTPTPQAPDKTTPEKTPEQETTETTSSEENKTETTEEKQEDKLPEKITIDGVGEVTLDELRNGYLRQTDYTKKTQEVSGKRKEAEEALALFNHLKANPQLAQQLLQTQNLPPTLDPTARKITELETKYFDMMLQQKIETLQNKYEDFEAMEVVKTAQEKGIADLEDAYLILKSHKAPQQKKEEPLVDKEQLIKELREQVIKELEEEKVSTSSIISSNDNATIIEDNTPKLSDGERRVARNMKLSDEEYAKWRDVGKKK